MARNVRKITISGDHVEHNGPCRLMGWAIRESGGSSSATALIYDDASTTAGPVIPLAVAAGGFAWAWFGGAEEGVYEPGVVMENGIYVDVGGSGTIQGVIFVLEG